MKQLHRWKLYFDKDLEESWLNQLAQQGWGLTSFCLGRYTFEPIEPGEYIYRVDLLPSDEEKKQEYFSLLREMGVEVIQQWGFWFFCRRRASEGPFELYSDAPSKASHYGRIARMFFLVALLEIVCALFQIPAILTGRRARSTWPRWYCCFYWAPVLPRRGCGFRESKGTAKVKNGALAKCGKRSVLYLFGGFVLRRQGRAG